MKKEELNYKKMLTDFIKINVNYAFEHGMDFFYISCPYNINPSIGGLYIIKEGNKEFFEKVKNYYGDAFVIGKKHWNIPDIYKFLSCKYKINLLDLY